MKQSVTYSISIDADYKPLKYWSDTWAIPITTIRTWIQNGKCPAKLIGGQYMISQLELLNWTPPESEKDGHGESEGRGDVRKKKERPAISVRASSGQKTSRWPV